MCHQQNETTVYEYKMEARSLSTRGSRVGEIAFSFTKSLYNIMHHVLQVM